MTSDLRYLLDGTFQIQVNVLHCLIVMLNESDGAGGERAGRTVPDEVCEWRTKQ